MKKHAKTKNINPDRNPGLFPEDYIAKQHERVLANIKALPPELNCLYEDEIKVCEKCPNFVCSRKMYRWGKPTMGYGYFRSPIMIVAQSPGPKGAVLADSTEIISDEIVAGLTKISTELVTIKTGDKKLTLTPDHPVLISVDSSLSISGTAWIEAKDLKPGYQVYILENEDDTRSLFSRNDRWRRLHNNNSKERQKGISLACSIIKDSKYELGSNTANMQSIQKTNKWFSSKDSSGSTEDILRLVQKLDDDRNFEVNSALFDSKEETGGISFVVEKPKEARNEVPRYRLSGLLESSIAKCRKATITEVYRKSSKRRVVDFKTVSEHYFANGILVHNCGTTGLVFEPASRTGRMYERILLAAGLSFDKVYTTNLIKCCTLESNSYPSKEEVANCLPFLLREIEVIKPKKIIAVGRFAANVLYENRNKLYGADLATIAHPGYILRSGKKNAEYMQDFVRLIKMATGVKSRQTTL